VCVCVCVCSFETLMTSRGPASPEMTQICSLVTCVQYDRKDGHGMMVAIQLTLCVGRR
jgi:hypothetical protein